MPSNFKKISFQAEISGKGNLKPKIGASIAFSRGELTDS